MVDTLKVMFTGTPRITMPARRRFDLPGGHVRFWHDGEGKCKAEVELPKLLWGHNGQLISNQTELDSSVARFREVLLQFVKFESWELTLIDLVWQFQTRTADIILAHQWLRFPGVRSLPTIFCGEKAISWRGGKLMLKFYRKANGVLRVELRLVGEQLRKRIDSDAPLNFDELYRVFRAEVLKLPTVQLPEARKHSMAEIIATMPTEFHNDAILTYQQGRKSRAVCGLKHDVSAARLKKVSWNLRELLPAENPPLPVHCESRIRRRIEL